MEVFQGGHHQRQQQQQPHHIVREKPQHREQPGFRRGLLKVSLEASPLQQIRAPPCNIRSIAVANVGSRDDRACIYLGTDSGLSFTLNKNLGLSPVDCLCPLPRAGAIAALLDKQVVVLDLFTLAVLEWLPSSKGAFTLARAFGSLQQLNGSISSHGIVSGRDSPVSPQTPRKSGNHGQLGRLFGAGRLSARRGGPIASTGESVANFQSSQSILSFKKKSLSPSEESSSQIQVFARDKSSRIEKFAVAVKQKLLLFTVSKENKVLKAASSNGTTITINLKEMVGPEEVVTMAWIENVVITGNYQEYMLFSVVDGRASLLFSLPQDLVSPPLLKVFPKELEVLLLMDAVGVAVNAAGHPTSSSLAFREIPDAVGQSSAYAVLVKRGVLELYHRKTGAKVQSITLSDATLGPNLLSEDEEGKFLMLASAFKVYFLERVPLDEQLKELLRQRQFDEAVALAEECASELDVESAAEKLGNVHAQAGFLLFFDLRFKDAVDHFLQSSTMHPVEIFPFFPSLTDRWRAMVPRIRYWGLHPPPHAVQNVVQTKLRAVQRGLVLQSVSDQRDLPNAQDGLMPTSSRSKSAIIQEYSTEAMAQVIRYLRVARAKPMTPSLQEGVDTLLMHLFLKLGATDEMESFAASENSCHVEELEDMLHQSGRLRTLGFLYESKGMVEKALQVWQTLADSSNTRISVPARRMQEIKNFNETENPGLQLAAAREASRLLEASQDGVLVLKHLKWILNVSQDLGIQILSSSKRERSIPPDVVLSELDPSQVYVRQRYLEWLVQEKAEEDSRYHTMLAVSLATSAMESSENAVVNASNFDERVPTRESSSGSRERLQVFLESSEKYDPSTVLALILDSDFWREQAILYRKLGEETRVFQILALKLGDIEAAERYCAELGRPDAYMRLLDMYLKPGDGREPMYNAAVHLLQSHGTSLDPLQVLEALSPDMPLQLAYETIARMFRSGAHKHRQGQIVRHLTRAENFKARLSRLEQRSRHTLVTDQSLCGSCFARFGTKLFALYPNDSVVCYKCFRNSGSTVDPVTGHNFETDIHSSCGS
ncbi:hypothetical protein GOP47_0012434 [Adiantum capillus-veneris]|uniref:CNH domain-containing protein n=1 Tax=Adiantum capillus-veneris TaxID=13818 RepID=A0A9D4UQN8_ADICA|nr:hypothetical protein GOP47_0012434 [Adiantum capillus-veneris]